MNIELKILNKEFYSSNHSDICPEGFIDHLPSYVTPDSAALDLVCCEDVTVYAGEVKAIHTGLALWIGSHGLDEQSKYGVGGMILPRSGLGTKGLVLANTVGLIDSDYQGELIVQAWNKNPQVWYYKENNETKSNKNLIEGVIKLKAGDRFAQLVFMPVVKAQWKVVKEFSASTNRGCGGFGSSGE